MAGMGKPEAPTTPSPYLPRPVNHEKPNQKLKQVMAKLRNDGTGKKH